MKSYNTNRSKESWKTSCIAYSTVLLILKAPICVRLNLLHYTYMKIYQPPLLYLLALALIVTSTSCQSHRIMQLHEDSGWCWFQDNRAIIDGDQLIFSGVNSKGYNIVSSYHFKTGDKQTVILNQDVLPPDDHNVGVLMVRPDSKYLTVYAGHGVDQWMRYRISSHPGDIQQWEPEQSMDVGGKVTYSNVYRLSNSGLTYNFHRGINRNPNYMFSDDDGGNWSYGGRLFSIEGRPYVRYASDGKNRIHFITTEEHPRHFNNGIYHAYIEHGKIYRSDGTYVGELSHTTDSAIKPTDFTAVFAGSPSVRKDVAWTSDIQLDKDGHPYIAFSVTKDPIALGETKNVTQGGFDHRYHYARWDGKEWREYEIAYAGTRLYPGENEYTGLITLHPTDPNVVYISADVDPATGQPLVSKGSQRREIFRGTSRDAGATWKWKAITQNSDEDNIRPIVLEYQGREVVIWLKGRYTTYTDYDL